MGRTKRKTKKSDDEDSGDEVKDVDQDSKDGEPALKKAKSEDPKSDDESNKAKSDEESEPERKKFETEKPKKQRSPDLAKFWKAVEDDPQDFTGKVFSANKFCLWNCR